MEAMGTNFYQWLEFVFDNPVRHRRVVLGRNSDPRRESDLTDTLIVQYMAQLSLSRRFLLITLDQVEQGLWFLIGDSSPG